MKVSIVTAVFDGAETIGECIDSVVNQDYPHIEHIIVDGGSTDGTLDIVRRYNGKIGKVVSEPDRGLYDAMNNGIKLASGQVVGILNADDMFASRHVIENVVQTLRMSNVDTCYGDLVYVDRENTNRILRFWKSGDYAKERFRSGWMPPHPTFFAKRSVYEKYGLLNLDFPLAADYELMLRFLYRHDVSTKYIPEVMIRMRSGGTSNPGLYTIKAIEENFRAWKVNGLKPHLRTFVMKPMSKLLQFIRKPS